MAAGAPMVAVGNAMGTTATVGLDTPFGDAGLVFIGWASLNVVSCAFAGVGLIRRQRLLTGVCGLVLLLSTVLLGIVFTKLLP